MDKKYDFLFQILLLGDGASGKTCLLKRYMDGNFSINFGVTISPSFQIKIIELDKIKIKLKIWDTAGVERFRAINKNYYKEANGFIFNFNIIDKNSLKELDYFINE